MIGQKMDVTFEGGKTIIEGTPALLFISSDGRGVGQLYDNGKRVTKLREVKIESKTNDFSTYDVKVAVIKEGE